MLIVHTPADGPVERYDFRTVRTSEASTITSLVTADLAWQQVRQQLRDEDPDVMRVVAFVLKKRSDESLRIADFDPLVGELAVKLDRREIEEWATIAAEKIVSVELPPAVLEASLSSILDEADDVEHARATIQKLISGKFPAGPAEPTTESSDPTPAESTSSEASSSASSPTSSTSTDEESTT
ncbi:hypothetical protein J3A78_003878 [Streptomyces sp. PvR006]|uniref:hypothetical protein n=1 Tax=Streptomyces sp. PvR006 TaxID=2817860 RepID=UPI001AE3A4B3|nr:hypothetical protein [Streptomyces sp. PvR006]MBP2583400.1 hypothetical protein [Streptomyces sp. PvR006]